MHIDYNKMLVAVRHAIGNNTQCIIGRARNINTMNFSGLYKIYAKILNLIKEIGIAIKSKKTSS